MSKLAINLLGTAKPTMRNTLKHAPNELQTWGQFLYRLSTILDVQNTAFIVPSCNDFGEIVGIYTVLPSRCTIVEYAGEPWIKYTFSNGQTAAMELSACGVMTKMQYKDDIFGEANNALAPTMSLINIQNQGIAEGVKNSNTYRFSARMSNFLDDKDLAKERKRFSKENFGSDSGGGLLLFPNTYSDITQLKSTPYVVDADQMAAIRNNVNLYFGTNEEILQNKAYGDAWAAFYEGAIEPFAIQLSDVLTKMLYTQREQSTGNKVMATSNRLQYMSMADKISYATVMGDRGYAYIDEIREVFNLPPLPDGAGQRAPIRGEYYFVGDDKNAGKNE